MNPFASVRTLFRPRTQPQATVVGFLLPFGLTEGGLRRLQILRSSDEWDTFAEVLDEVVKFNAETLLGSQRTEDVHFYRGFISGVRKAASIIDEISQGEQRHLSEKQRLDNVGKQNAGTTALFGTPAWRRHTTNT